MPSDNRRPTLTAMLVLIAAATGAVTAVASAETAELTIWDYGWTRPSPDYLQKVADAYAKDHPGLKFTVVGVDGDYNSKLLAAAAAGAAPDIALVDAGNFSTPLAAQGLLVPLDAFGAGSLKPLFYPPAWDSMVWQGQVYGLRAEANNLAMFYNKAMFRDAGIELPTNDWDWTTWQGDSQKLTDPDKHVIGTTFAQGANAWTWMPFLWSNGGEFEDPGQTKALFNQEPGVEALQTWVTMVQNGTMRMTGGLNSFQSAIEENGPWVMQSFDAVKGLDYGIAFIPQNGARGTNMGGEGFAVMASSKHPREAYEFIKYVTTTPDIIADFDKYFGGDVPALRAAALKYAQADPRIQVFIDQLAYARLRPYSAVWDKIDQASSQWIDKAVKGQAPPKAALDSAALQVNAILQQANGG